MSIRQGLVTSALILGLAGPAAAFDMPPPIDAPEIDTRSIASSTEGWYIRGDLGWNASIKSGDPSYRLHNYNTDSYTDFTFDHTRLGEDFTLSAGAGYQFNDFLRSDVTLDWFTSSVRGNTQTTSTCVTGQPAGTYCGFSHKQDVGVLSLLANGYVDLGTYWGLTPYLGAGAGVSNVKWDSMKTSVRCVNGGSNCAGQGYYGDVINEGSESWRLTYALMAGMSYDVSSRVKIDLGYRYSHIGEGNMFDFNTFEASMGAAGTKGKDKGFDRHEFRTGIRLVNW